MISLSLSESTTDPTKQNHFGTDSPASLKAFENIVTGFVWSPIVWKTGLRLKSQYESCSYFALDFDSGVPLAEMVAFATDGQLAHIIGTTKSHQKEKVTASGKVSPAVDRFRVLFKASEPCRDRELYEYNMGLMVDYFGADPSCTDAARFFFPCKEIVSAAVGKTVGWMPFDASYVPESERYAARRARLAAMGAQGVPPTWLGHILTGRVVVPEGERHKTVYRIGCNFADLGWPEDLAVETLMKTTLSEIGEQDVRRCIANGFRAATGV